jgi:hypothetical protein
MSVIEFKLKRERPKDPEPVYECLKCNSFHFQIRGAVACSNCGSVISNLVVKKAE